MDLKNRKQSKTPMVLPYNVVRLSLKRNKLSSHKKTWTTVKSILLSERSQCEKLTYVMILKKAKPQRQ